MNVTWGMISYGFSWWIEGLAAGLLSIERQLSPPRRFQLHANERPFVLRSLDRNKQPLTPAIEILEGEVSSLAPSLKEKRGLSEIEIVVPDTAVLENQLEPLPSESRPYVDDVVRHRIETLFPWHAADTLFATEVTDHLDERIAVKVRATPRGAIAPALEAAIACGAAQVSIVRDSEQSLLEAKSIPAFVGQQVRRRFERAKSIARYAVIGILFATTALITESIFIHTAITDDIAELEHTLAERRAILKLRSNRQGTLSALESKKRESAVAVVVLEQLSKILPSDTYLTDLTLEAGQLKITGVSAHAADLVPLLEGSGYFRNASFYAPTTRQAEGMDHFSIQAGIIPNSANEQ
jgi:general secretion pathway protein L